MDLVILWDRLLQIANPNNTSNSYLEITKY